MPFTLSEVVPWGRSYDEYVAMFSLSPVELQQRILGCGDGPASFNSTLTRQNGAVVSVDPLYAYTAEQIQTRIDQTYDMVLDETRRNRHEFVWERIPSVEELGRMRMAAMNEFIKDYERGKRERRYINAGLPRLSFADKAFDIALCSHFLFLYSEQLTEEFHLESIRELCRVAQTVKIFPVLELGSVRSRHLAAVMRRLKREGIRARLTRVAYEFQKGGDEMLVVTG